MIRDSEANNPGKGFPIRGWSVAQILPLIPVSFGWLAMTLEFQRFKKSAATGVFFGDTPRPSLRSERATQR